MKKNLLLLLLLLMSALMMACSAQAENPPMVEDVIEVNDQNIEVYGRVAVGEIKQITLNQSVFVESVDVKVGEKLTSTDTILTLNMDELERQRTLLELKAESLRSQLENDNIAYLKANQNYKTIKEKYDTAKENYEKQKKLYDANVIAHETLKRHEDEMNAFENELNSANLSVTSSLSDSANSSKTLELELKELENKLEDLNAFFTHDNIQDHKIVSGMDEAIVSSINVQAGAYNTAYTPIIELYDTSTLLVKASINEEFMKTIKIGQDVTIVASADSETVYEGTISFVSSKAVLEGGETVIPIEITFNETNELFPNLNVDVMIPME